MKYAWMSLPIALATFGAVALAQTPGGQSSSSLTGPSSSNPPALTDQTITVSGCLQTVDLTGATVPSISGPATATRQNQFVLLNATISPLAIVSTTPSTDAPDFGAGRTATNDASAATPVGTSGTLEPAVPASKSYRLEGKSDEIVVHNGQRVEVTGLLMPPMPSAVAATDSDPDVGATNRDDRPSKPSVSPRVQVTSLRTLAETCP